MSTSKRAAKTAGTVALYVAANIIFQPLRFVTGEEPRVLRPRTPAQQRASLRARRADRFAAERAHVIDRHLSGKRLEPTWRAAFAEHHARHGHLPTWFTDATGATTIR